MERNSIIFKQGKTTENKELACFLPQLKLQQFQEFVTIVNSKDTPFIILCENPKEVFDRFWKDLKLIEAAGGIVGSKKNGQQRFLFIVRLGFLDLPKGKLNKNEDPIVGASREIQEECGISEIVLKRELATTFHVYRMFGKTILKKTHWFEFEYHGNEVLVPQTEEDITDVFWLTKSEILNRINQTYSSLLGIIRDVVNHS